MKKALGAYRIGIKCPAPIGENGTHWGDYNFAYALKRAFESHGYQARVDLRQDWYHPRTLSDDVAIVLRGQIRYRPMASQINLLWLISHPDDARESELETFDHVFVASESYAKSLAERLSVPASQLLQCSDPDSFHPPSEPNGSLKHDLLFVGNTRGEMRQVIADAISKQLPVSIFGSGWEKFLPPSRVAGSHIPNHILHEYYAGAKVTLNDQWPDMEREGFLSNRIFDIALSGGFVISRDFKGSDIFGHELVTYRDADDLDQQCRNWLKADTRRRELAERLRQRVLAFHTFSHRAAEIIKVIEALHSRRNAPPTDAPLSPYPCFGAL